MLKILMASLLIIAPLTLRAECLHTPVHGEKLITSNFGWRFHPNLGYGRPHEGMDLRARLMTPVYAAANGTVTYRNYSGQGGDTISILGNDGITTKYLHLSAYKVAFGDSVASDQLIAFSGNTSDFSDLAPHLHFIVQTNQGKVDPRGYMCEKIAEKSDAGPEIDPKGNGQIQNVPAPSSNVAGGSSSAPGAFNGSSMPDSAPNMKGWDGRSEQEIMFSEVSRRYLNPAWQAQITTCNPDAMLIGTGNVQYIKGGAIGIVDCDKYMYNELVEINSLQLLMDSKKYEARERIELMIAASLAEKTKRGSSSALNTMRESASKVSGIANTD